jgi:hypothetical protein
MTKTKFTPQWAEKIAFEYIERFCVCCMLGLYGQYYTEEINDHLIRIVLVYPFDLSKSNNRARFIEVIIHEIIHVFRCVWGLPQTEHEVDREAKRFCAAHPKFARDLVIRILVDAKKCDNAQSFGSNSQLFEFHGSAMNHPRAHARGIRVSQRALLFDLHPVRLDFQYSV